MSEFFLPNKVIVCFLLFISLTYSFSTFSTRRKDFSQRKSHTTLEAETNAFSSLALAVAQCLLASDAKRDTGFDGASTGWTSWIEQKSEAVLRECIDKLCIAGGDNIS